MEGKCRVHAVSVSAIENRKRKLQVLGDGSESNVVGLPMERLAELLENFAEKAETVNIDTNCQDTETKPKC